MGQIPFSVYDFFSYLCAGCIVLVAGDYAFNDAGVLHGSLGTLEAVVWIILAYVTGHALANFARTIVERWLVEGVIGRIPTENLMGKAPPGRWRAALFSDYFRPLPLATQQRVRERADAVGLPEISLGAKDDSGDAARALRNYCQYTRAAESDGAPFPTLRDFSRNASLACAIAAAMILVAESPPSRIWGFVAAVAAFALFYRFLRFHRFYEADLLNAFSVAVHVDARHSSTEGVT